MPKEKEIEKSIPAFYKKSAVDLCMFSYVQGFMGHCRLIAFPTTRVRDAIKLFMKEYNLNEEDYPIETAIRNYSKIASDFLWRDKVVNNYSK
jgi:hypothetical protein